MTRLPTSLARARRLAAAVALLLCCSLTASAIIFSPVAPHRSQGEPDLVFMGSILRAVSREVRIVAASPDPRLAKENRARDRSGRFEAFTVADSAPGVSGTVDRIFFTDRRAKRTYEIRGLLNPQRPFNDLTFKAGGLLQFERWANPHAGVRYRVDVRRRKLVSARSFFDADYVERQRKGGR
jgi:hypothetical protein